jgi:hypothetical protein
MTERERVRNTRPRQVCALCGADDRPLKAGRCSECDPATRQRLTLRSSEAKIRSWGDVEGQLDLFEAGE